MKATGINKTLLESCVQYSLSCLLISVFFVTAVYGADDSWTAARTEYGSPDLQGVWGNLTQTSLQRPTSLGEKRSYSEEEARELEEQLVLADQERAKPIDPNRGAPELGSRVGTAADNNFVPERYFKIAKVNGEYRTSLLIEPADGRIPYVEGALSIHQKWLAQGFGALDGPEIRDPGERCMSYPAQLPVIAPLTGTHTRLLQIVQTENYVVIFGEYNVSGRIVRMNSEHPENGWGKWLGDSIGYWEGETLVVHTKDFRPEQSNNFIRSSGELQVTEKFTAVSENQLLYSYTFEDPTMYTQAFTAEMPMDRMQGADRMYEQSCHEGNYSLPGILAGGRRQEMDAQQ